METDEDLIGDIIFIDPIEMMMSESYEEWKRKYKIPVEVIFEKNGIARRTQSKEKNKDEED